MTLTSVILFILSLVVICVYSANLMNDDEWDYEPEFTLFDVILVIVCLVYFVWFIIHYALSYFG